jgi:Mg-chelatase subunit ChlD
MSRAASVAFVALLLAGPAASGVGGPGSDVDIHIDSPAPGVVVTDRIHHARITGSAAAESLGPQPFDVVLVIDVSGSTKAASGSDVDGDGVVGVNPRSENLPRGAFPPDVLSTDPQDSVLHAEIAAANALLDTLKPERVRVGVVTFAGEVDPSTGLRKRVDQADAWLEVPLTSDYGRVRQALASVLARGATGATNFAAGVRLALRELAGLSGAVSSPRDGARRVMLFLTDGIPTLPVDRGSVSDPGDVQSAIRAAELAAGAGVLINTYALGPAALKYRRAVTEMARISAGTYTPVQNPGDIVLLLRGVSFADVEDVVLINLTTGDFSEDVRLHPDGSFVGFVPTQEGMNRVRVSVLATDGSRDALEFNFEFRHSDLDDREKLRELERLRLQTKELLLKREAEKIRAFREEQRKELILEGGAEE